MFSWVITFHQLSLFFFLLSLPIWSYLTRKTNELFRKHKVIILAGLFPALSCDSSRGPFSSFPPCIPRDKHTGLKGCFGCQFGSIRVRFTTFHFEEGGIFSHALLPLAPTRQVCATVCVSHHDELLSATNEFERLPLKTARQIKWILHFRRYVTISPRPTRTHTHVQHENVPPLHRNLIFCIYHNWPTGILHAPIDTTNPRLHCASCRLMLWSTPQHSRRWCTFMLDPRPINQKKKKQHDYVTTLLSAWTLS